jgi:hypothetical protein
MFGNLRWREMSEQVLLMVSPIRTVVGSDVLPRRLYTMALGVRRTSLLQVLYAGLRPQSDRGKRHELGLFTYARDYAQIEKGNSVEVGIEPSTLSFPYYFALLPSIVCGDD